MTTWGIARYEMKLQLRSLVFWLALVLAALMLFSEVYTEPHHRVTQAVSYQKNATEFLRLWQEPEKIKLVMEDLLQNGYSGIRGASLWADRMQIVFVFAALFTAGFMLERDRLTRAQEVLAARPVGPWAYVCGKFLGALLPLLGAALISMLAAMGVQGYLNGLLGRPPEPLPYLHAGVVLLLPTMVYATALVVALTALLPRAAAAVPLYLAYMGAGGLIPSGGRFPLGLTAFIVRTEGRAIEILQEPMLSTVLANRALYLGLTAALLLAAGWVYGCRLRRGGAV